MTKNLLLPHGFQKIGWVILVPAAILGLIMWIDDFNGFPIFLYPGGDQMNINDPGYLFCTSETTRHLLNNIALIGTLVGSIFITCSRVRVEDEMIGNIRLNALLAALYINFACVIAAAVIIYDLGFLYIMIYSLVGMPLLFLLIFQWKLWRLRKEACNEE